MIKTVTTKEVIDKKQITSVICDVCKKEFFFGDWKEKSQDGLEIQEFTSINRTGGYGSIFGDMNEIKLDICQHCLKEKLGQFIRINEETK